MYFYYVILDKLLDEVNISMCTIRLLLMRQAETGGIRSDVCFRDTAVADAVAKLQIANRGSDRDRFHSGICLPSGSVLENFSQHINEEVDGSIVINGESADFETVVGRVVDDELVPGLLFDSEVSVLVLKRAGALPVPVKKAVGSVVETGSYTVSIEGFHSRLTTDVPIIQLSSPKYGDFREGIPLIDQIEFVPEFHLAADILVADSPSMVSTLDGADFPCDSTSSCCSPPEADPVFTRHAEMDIDLDISRHLRKGRLGDDWPANPYTELVSEASTRRIHHKLAAGIARCMGDAEVECKPHVFAAAKIIDQVYSRIEAIEIDGSLETHIKP